MSKRKKRSGDGHPRGPFRDSSHGSSEGRPDPVSARPARGGGGPGDRRRGHGGRSRKTWLQTHGRDLRFLAIFAFLMGLYYLASTTRYAQDTVFPSYLRLNARVAGAILGFCGYDITVTIQPSTPDQGEGLSTQGNSQTLLATLRTRLAEYVHELAITEESTGVTVTPNTFLGRDKFVAIASIIEELGGHYISASKESRFLIPTDS